MAPQPCSLRTSFRVLSITRTEIKECVIYMAEGDTDSLSEKTQFCLSVSWILRKICSMEKSIQSAPFDMLITRTRGQIDTRIFSPLAVAGLCVTIGRYWYLFKRLTAISAGRFYRFAHIEAYSSFKAHSKQWAVSRPAYFFFDNGMYVLLRFRYRTALPE